MEISQSADSSVERARDFYGRVLGLPEIKRPDRLGGHVAFTMAGSLDDIAKHLDAEGIAYARGRAGLPQIFREDPAGTLVELNTGWAQEAKR